jgi:transposase-like protein
MTMATSTEQPSAATASTPTGRGGRSPLRKLSEEQELELTRLYSQTETSVPEIATRFNVGESSVYRISQRHGAKLRSRGADARPRRTAAAKPAAAASSSASTAQARPASGTTATRAPRGRPRRTAAATITAAAAATPATGTRRRRGSAGGAVAAATTSGTSTLARRRAASTTTRRGTTAARGRRGTARSAQATAISVTAGSYRVVFQTELVIHASSIQDAIRQAEARGARDISSVTAAG